MVDMSHPIQLLPGNCARLRAGENDPVDVALADSEVLRPDVLRRVVTTVRGEE